MHIIQVFGATGVPSSRISLSFHPSGAIFYLLEEAP